MSEERIRELIGRFASDDLQDAGLAEEELKNIGKPAIPYLVEALSDPDARIREWATRALHYKRDPSVVDALITTLDDVNPRVRGGAAWALGTNSDLRAVEPLIRSAEDADPTVRSAAINSLGSLGDERGYNTLESALQDSDSDVRGAAIRSMFKANHPRCVNAILSGLKDEDREVRCTAAVTVAYYRDREKEPDAKLIQPIIKALDDDYYIVRTAAIRALSSFNMVDVVDKLIAMLKSDPHARVREAATQVLGELKDERAITPLREALNDEANRVKVAAAGSLRNLGTEVDPVFELSALDDNDWLVRIEAINVLKESNDQSAVDILIRALNDEDHRVRLHAAWSLGNLQDKRAVEPLLSTLGDPNYMVRHYALTALWQFDDPRIEEQAISLLNDSHFFVREQAAIYLSFIRSKRAVVPLIEIVKEQPDSYLKARAAGALYHIDDPQGHAVLMDALDKHDICVVEGAYAFFIRKGVPGSEELLIQALNKYGRVRMARDFTLSDNELLAQAGQKWIEEHPDELKDFKMEPDEDYPLPEWSSES